MSVFSGKNYNLQTWEYDVSITSLVAKISNFSIFGILVS